MFKPNTLWCDSVANAVEKATGEWIIAPIQTKGVRSEVFMLKTASGIKASGYVRICVSSREICLGIDGSKRLGSKVLRKVFAMARDAVFGPEHPMPTRSPPKPRKVFVCLADFHGDDYGEYDYLSLRRLDYVTALPPPEYVESCGWSYGRHESGATGWYPPSFVREL